MTFLRPLTRRRGRIAAPETATLLRGAAVGLALQLGATAIGYALQIVLARTLGVSGYGSYSIAFTAATLLSIAITFGVPSMLVRFMPAYEEAGDYGRMRGALSFGRRFVVRAGFVVAAAGTAVVLGLNRFVPLGHVELLLVTLWAAPSIALLDLQMSTARSLRRLVVGYGPQQIVVPGLVAAGAAALAAAGVPLTAPLALAGFALVGALVLPIQFFLIQRRLPARARAAERTWERPLWLKTSAAFVFLVGFSVLIVQTDVLLLGKLLGSVPAGLYAAAAKTTSLTVLASEATAAIAAPLFAAAYASGDRERLQRVVTTATHAAFWPGALVAAFLLLFPGAALGLFGSGFADGARVLAVLALSQVAAMALGPNGYILGMTGNQREQLVVNGIAVVVNAGLMLVTIPTLGLVGAAVATGVTLVVTNIVMHALVVRRIDVRPSILAAVRGTALRTPQPDTGA